jgi:hypothetical protein
MHLCEETDDRMKCSPYPAIHHALTLASAPTCSGSFPESIDTSSEHNTVLSIRPNQSCQTLVSPRVLLGCASVRGTMHTDTLLKPPRPRSVLLTPKTACLACAYAQVRKDPVSGLQIRQYTRWKMPSTVRISTLIRAIWNSPDQPCPKRLNARVAQQ